MQKSLVFVCPQHKEWSTDDGTRLTANSWEEWYSVHLTFARILQENNIPFYVIPMELVDLEDRVDYVMNMWRVYGNTVSRISLHIG
jgi:hypothetical protein